MRIKLEEKPKDKRGKPLTNLIKRDKKAIPKMKMWKCDIIV